MSIFMMLCIMGLFNVTAFAVTVSQVNVDYVSLEAERKVIFKSSASAQLYTVQQTTWGTDLYDKVYSLLMTADNKGNKVNFDYTVFVINGISIYEVTSVTISPLAAPPALCNGSTDNTNKTTYLTSLTLSSGKNGTYTFATKCSSPATFNVNQATVGSATFNKLFTQHLASLTKNKKVLLSCTANTSNVLRSRMYRQ